MVETAVVLFTRCFFPVFMVGSFRYYWMLLLPFLAVLAALEAESLYRSISVGFNVSDS